MATRRPHAAPVQFTSPRTVGDRDCDRVAFKVDPPRIERNTCTRNTGVGCTVIPTTDDGSPAAFWPFPSSGAVREQCVWLLGNDSANVTTNDFGKNHQYSPPLSLTDLAFGSGGATLHRCHDFRQTLGSNPCPSS